MHKNKAVKQIVEHAIELLKRQGMERENSLFLLAFQSVLRMEKPNPDNLQTLIEEITNKLGHADDTAH